MTCWEKTAELCGQYLKKGSLAYIEGRIQTREYEKDGQKKSVTEIVADRVLFLGGKSDGAKAGAAEHPGVAKAREMFKGGGGFGEDDGLPF